MLYGRLVTRYLSASDRTLNTFISYRIINKQKCVGHQ